MPNHNPSVVRLQPAGPVMPTPGAQCLGTIAARLALLPRLDPRAARDAELGLWAVAAGRDPLAPEGRPLLAVEPRAVVLTALKPAEDGEGMVLRLLNPTDTSMTARVRFGLPVASAVSVRLDETADGGSVAVANGALALEVGARALRSVLVRGR